MKDKPEAGECLGGKLASSCSQAVATLCAPTPVSIFVEEHFESAEVLAKDLDEFAEARNRSQLSFNESREACGELRKACVFEPLG
jgi:hypothetical protein